MILTATIPNSATPETVTATLAIISEQITEGRTEGFTQGTEWTFKPRR